MSVFDQQINQKGTVDEKHDQLLEFFPRDDLLPMWVAEMDFQSAPCVMETMKKRVEHGIFGYSYRSDEYYQSIIDWYKNQHHVSITKEMLSFDTGVLKSIFEMIRIFTSLHDDILVPIPAYPQFEKVVTLSERNFITFSLTNKQNRYYFNFEALKQELKHCRMMILCSPHNPGGQIWSKEELKRIVEICDESDTILISDEIHCDLHMNHKHFTSLAEISDHCIVINSPSKSFNLAGLQHSYSICKDQVMRELIEKHYTRNKIKSSNTLSMIALESAYREGSEWLIELRDYLYHNYLYILSFIQDHHLDLVVHELEAGYLLWIDFSSYFKEAIELEDFLVNTCRIATSFGRNFDVLHGCYTRLNIGTQRINCEEAMKRIEEGLKKRNLK